MIPDRAVYATQPHPLRNQIENLLARAPRHDIEGEILGLIVPDSNRIIGGGVSAEVFNCLRGREYETVIVVSPSHTGPFERMNICSVDVYRTPLGDVPVNDRVRNELCDEDDDIYLDDEGHYHTEGVDVQLPYLQCILPAFDVVPIVMGDESPDFCRELGAAVGEVMYNRPTLLVATVDIAAADVTALHRLEEFFKNRDVSSLMSLLNSEDIVIEGKGPLLVSLLAAHHRRATHARVLHSVAPHDGETGYFGAVLYKE